MLKAAPLISDVSIQIGVIDMGLYSHLFLSANESPSASDGYIVDTEISCRWIVPMGWIALLDTNNFQIHIKEEDGEVIELLYSSTNIQDAIENLKTRSRYLSQAIGASWDLGLSPFTKYLFNQSAKFVHIDFTELGDESLNPSEQRATYIEAVKVLGTPPTKRKKSFLGKEKVVITTPWKNLLQQTTDYDPKIDLPCWSWFGGPLRGLDDWV